MFSKFRLRGNHNLHKDPKGSGSVQEGFEVRIGNNFDKEVLVGQPKELVLRYQDLWRVTDWYDNQPIETEES